MKYLEGKCGNPRAQQAMARKTGSGQVSSDRKRFFVDMKKAGMRVGHIARYYDMPPSTVSNVTRRFKQSNNTTMKKRGPKFKLSSRSLRLFRNYVVSNRWDPLYAIVARFTANTGIKLHENTARNYIKKLCIASYVVVQKPFKTPNHLLDRLQWTREHESWTLEKRMHVMFTDELSFTVRPMSNRLRVWRKKGSGGCNVALCILLSQAIKL